MEIIENFSCPPFSKKIVKFGLSEFDGKWTKHHSSLKKKIEKNWGKVWPQILEHLKKHTDWNTYSKYKIKEYMENDEDYFIVHLPNSEDDWFLRLMISEEDGPYSIDVFFENDEIESSQPSF